MISAQINKVNVCPVRILLDQLSDRWAVLALFALKDGPVRFNALRRELDGITQKVLGQTLQRLRANGLVKRTVVVTKPIAVEYRLTELGGSLLPRLEELRRWALSNDGALITARLHAKTGL